MFYYVDILVFKSFAMKAIVILCTILATTATQEFEPSSPSLSSHIAVDAEAILHSVAQVESDLSKLNIDAPSRSSVNSRIVGGEEVVPHSYPHQAGLIFLTDEGWQICGGSIISRKYILTAAHCLDKALVVQVILGAHNISEQEPTQKRYVVRPANLTIHENWNPSQLLNDIAVLELPEQVELNENIQLVTLPTKGDIGNSLVGNWSVVSGWGIYSDEIGVTGGVLKHVRTKVIGNLPCGIPYGGGIRSGQICTSGCNGKSTCGGDSGGPLLVDNKQVGIVSFGYKAGCELGWPAVFTRVTEYLDWIANNTDVVIN